MAERSLDNKKVVSQNKKRPTSTSKVETSRRAELRRPAKSASGPTKTLTDDLLAKEEHYKRLNAELEAKTAELVKQAEQLMKDQGEALSKPPSNILLSNEDGFRNSKPQLDHSGKVVTKIKATTTAPSMCSGQQGKEPQASRGAMHLDGVAEDSADVFLAKTIQSMEERMNDAALPETVVDDVPDVGELVGPGIMDAQIRVLKAKLRIMQEELDQLSGEYYKKDDENAKLCTKIKELEDERTRLQKSSNIQQAQIEKHRALAEDSAKKNDALQLQVSALRKEVENLNRTQKQAAAVHGSVEVRLNRSLEEVERLKAQLNQMKLTNKDKISEEHQSKENLLAENKMLKKQKAELVAGFRKQLKLIDVLKRQKMHFEAAKLLSFTEEEFMKALDWGKS